MSLKYENRLTAPVTNISRCSVHDGPGVRTVVYLKGCSMKCRWCHNPETISARPVILYLESKCIGCGRCAEICPDCHTEEDGRHVFLRENCRVCGKCAEICPRLALTLCGREMTVEDVMKEVRKDAHFYRRSGGGITLSGGECLLHPEFSAALLAACRAEGIHTAVESALYADRTAIEKILPYTDLVFADCKLPDGEKHLRYTGREQEKILDNIRYLAGSGVKVILRIPVIPGVNDGEADAAGFAERIASFGDGIGEIELLRYNNLASSKYEIAGMTYVSFGNSPQTDAEMTVIRDRLAAHLPGKNVYYV